MHRLVLRQTRVQTMGTVCHCIEDYWQLHRVIPVFHPELSCLWILLHNCRNGWNLGHVAWQNPLRHLIQKGAKTSNVGRPHHFPTEFDDAWSGCGQLRDVYLRYKL